MSLSRRLLEGRHACFIEVGMIQIIGHKVRVRVGGIELNIIGPCGSAITLVGSKFPFRTSYPSIMNNTKPPF